MEYKAMERIEKEVKTKYAKQFLKKYPTGSVFTEASFDKDYEVIPNQVEITLSVDSHECPYEGFRDAWEYQKLPELIEVDGIKYRHINSECESFETTYTSHIYEVQE